MFMGEKARKTKLNLKLWRKIKKSSEKQVVWESVDSESGEEVVAEWTGSLEAEIMVSWKWKVKKYKDVFGLTYLFLITNHKQC